MTSIPDAPEAPLPPQVEAAPHADDRQAKRNVAVLVTAQAILGAQIVMHMVMGGLAGTTLAPTPILATLPISLTVFGSMCTAPWLAPFMQTHGRRAGFLLGALAGGLGALMCAAALVWASFGLFLAGSFLMGIYMSAQGFYRFAATDSASEGFRAKAISYVMAGGLASALLGPQLVKLTADVTAIPFVATYLIAAMLNLGGMWLFFLLRAPRPAPRPADAPRGRTRRELLSDPVILTAVICAMVSYSLMNLVMTSTPLAVVGCGFGVGNAADVVSAHVIAMFAPSFFTGHLIARFGTTRVIATGLGALALAGVVALSGVELLNFYAALILLGVGWNFGFIGATALLTANHAAHERGAVQGMNDAVVFGSVTLASLASGGLMNSVASPVQGWAQVNYAMGPFLALAAGALIWMSLRARRPA
jgi:MFS family permease